MIECISCGAAKEETEFRLRKLAGGNTARRKDCNECNAEYQRNRRATESQSEKDKRKDYILSYRASGRFDSKEYKRKLRLEKKTIKLSNCKHEHHVMVYQQEIKKGKIKHDQHVKDWRRDASRIARWKSMHDVRYNIYHRLKRWVNKHCADKKASKKWSSILGYSTEELCAHIEKQFKDGMSWSNKGKWHVDHIIPVCSFDIREIGDDEFNRCFSLSNLRPLWAKENLAKGKRIFNKEELNINKLGSSQSIYCKGNENPVKMLEMQIPN